MQVAVLLVIKAEVVDCSAVKILKVLKEENYATRSVSSRNNVFYFDGWDRLGASAVLRAIATATSSDVKRALAELEFDQVIHIDCSMWESKRALQRKVAQQLKLRAEVLKMFDRQDEEDDFRGVAQGSRAELQEFVREMHQHIQKLNHKFLVIFHNGSSEEIDLARLCGFPLSGYSTNKGDTDTIGPAADDDSLWRVADALQREIQLDVDYHQYLPSHLVRCAERKPYWTSPTYGAILIPTGAIPNGDMFQHFDKLSVLKLSRCTFNFRSPPFLCCHSLWFLWLDHCKDIGINTDREGKEGDVSRCFQRLWVLDVRYTDCSHILSAQMLDLMTQLRELNVIGANDWDMGHLQGRLPNICKLRIKECNVDCSFSENNLFSEMNKMELLDFSRSYTYMMPISICHNNSSCLETVIIDSSENSQLDEVPGLTDISFRGCTKLKNLLLRGIISKYFWTLDISNTAVKTLDLTGTERIVYLDELYLLGCENLCAITWPPPIKDKTEKVRLTKLCIDTTHEFPWNISVRDARFLTSLEAVYSNSRQIYVEVSSPANPTVAAGGCKDEGIKSQGSSGQQVLVSLQQQTAPAIYAADRTLDHLQQVSEDQMSSPGGKEASGTIAVPEFVLKCARILHVHDRLSISTIPLHMDLKWHNLEWCKIERCPRVDHVFSGQVGFTYRLRTFWASQLLKARCIWRHDSSTFSDNFPDLTVLHLHCCPRLIHVLHLFEQFIDTFFPLDSLRQLKTLEITWCGDLQEVFPLGLGTQLARQKEPLRLLRLDLPSLKHIHLHELPRLQHICKVKISAPNLETVKIRGCWSLKRLPDVSGSNKVVECDCEKEWWDGLEWEDSSQASLYKPIHSRYYKKTLLKGTVLR
ncbi:unnamed protein product [Urochloa decumbens]|uniref:Disease resistance protein At4g27190-like leucine-rich repeats domain-containing protein n=1 Tax=Urochloa decumbens TaxID=240449 RepID=A0ABC9GAM5_9POAL